MRIGTRAVQVGARLLINVVTQVRFSQDVSKSFGYDISLVQPMYYNDNGQGSATGAPQTANASGG